MVLVESVVTDRVCHYPPHATFTVAKIPTLAPHFGVGIMGTNNKETQAVPIIGLDNSDLSVSSVSSYSQTSAPTRVPLGPPGSFVARQPPKLVELVARSLKIADYAQLVNWELELFDVTPATTFGLDGEFISACRIDDKLCSWAAMMALLEADNVAGSDGDIKICALFDDEEIGSLLRQGAKANLLPLVCERAVEALCAHAAAAASSGAGVASAAFGPGLMGRTYARSFLVSADVTHAVNPNFLERYLTDHAPRLNVGVAICADSNGHMTTDAVSTAILQRVAELGGCTLQTFMIRNDSRSGGTVGPSLSALMGVKAADAGIPQLSMHSIRATTGALDPGLGKKFFKAFYERWEQVEAEWH